VRVGIEAEILLALAGDEFGPALLAEYYRQPLKTHPLLLGGKLIECPFDVDSQDSHSYPAIRISTDCEGVFHRWLDRSTPM